MPLAESRVPDKICTERTIGIFEDKIDFIAYTLAILHCFRKTSAEYVNSVRNIAFGHAVISLADQRMGAVMAALRSSGAKRVLDLGCGEGRLLWELLKDKTFSDI